MFGIIYLLIQILLLTLNTMVFLTMIWLETRLVMVIGIFTLEHSVWGIGRWRREY